jgi:hypothetical protein
MNTKKKIIKKVIDLFLILVVFPLMFNRITSIGRKDRNKIEEGKKKHDKNCLVLNTDMMIH